MLFFIFTFKVYITNSVIFLFEVELTQLNLSKILPMREIGVYIVLIVINTISYFYNNKNDIDKYFQSLMA